MATLYLRGNVWWVAWYEGKVRIPKSTGYLAAEKEKALEVKRSIERELKAAKTFGLVTSALKTVGAYRKHWLLQRERAGVASASDDAARLRHALELDSLGLSEIRQRHVRELVRRLRTEGRLAARTIRHVVGTLHKMFEDAIGEELMVINPAKLKRGDLPPKKDADPTWRRTAIYARDEVEALISDLRIPLDRRTVYALLFLTGCRVGELADRRWRDLDSAREPLGCLHVHSSFHTKKRKSKTTKADLVREVPVHPTLAPILKRWKEEGWAKMMGRKPELDDLLIPTAKGRQRTSNHVRNKLLADLARVGLRARRTHDTRRTFISLALGDGARKDVLRWVTHGAKDIMDLYTTMPWPALCESVGCLKIRAVRTATPTLQAVSGGNES